MTPAFFALVALTLTVIPAKVKDAPWRSNLGTIIATSGEAKAYADRG